MQWSEQKIKEGFERFFTEHGHYPTAHEIDSYSYLPSSRQIQRKFGGLPHLRQKLGLPISDFTTGEIRSSKARFIGKRGLDHEQIIKKFLIGKFGEICVHEQQPTNDYASRFDFVVYAKDQKFGIDVFFPESIRNVVGCVNHKEKIYGKTEFDVIFVQANNSISQENIELLIKRRKKPLPNNIRIFNTDVFFAWANELKPIQII